jgi:hypothetical protein
VTGRDRWHGNGSLVIAALLLLPSIDAQSVGRQPTEDERAAILKAFQVRYLGETILDIEADDLDGPFPRVSVTFNDRERTSESRLLQVVDCDARVESERDPDSKRIGLRVFPEHWNCSDADDLVVLPRAPPARVRIQKGVPQELTERLLSWVRSHVGSAFVTLTRVETTDGGRYSLHYTRRDGVGVTWLDPKVDGFEAPSKP